MPSFSGELENTLHRSIAYANQRRHATASTEHLLLSLLEDPDAADILLACGADIGAVRQELLADIRNANSHEVTDGLEDAKPSNAFQRIIQRAVIHVQSSGREIVNGGNVLVAVMSEQKSLASKLIESQGLSRYDLVNYIAHGNIPKGVVGDLPKMLARRHALELGVDGAAISAPEFVYKRNRLHFIEKTETEKMAERKRAASARCRLLKSLCDRRGNEQPQLAALVAEYSKRLRVLRSGSGAYSLFLAGADIETLLQAKSAAPADADRNVPIDGELLLATHSLIIAHAGLMALFPDITETVREIDLYRSQSETIDALRSRILEPTISSLSRETGIFDSKAIELTREIVQLDVERDPPNQLSTSAKHRWLRGALAAMGSYILSQTKKISAVARDSLVKEGVSSVLSNHDKLSGYIISFLSNNKDQLQVIATALKTGFGWLTALLSFLRI